VVGEAAEQDPGTELDERMSAAGVIASSTPVTDQRVNEPGVGAP
jgi:hypothetical protein